MIIFFVVSVVIPIIFFVWGYFLGKDRAFKEACLIVDGLERAHKHQLEFLANHLRGTE